MSEAGGGDLFIVDNSVSGWTGLEYLRQWSDLARSFDIATGFFEIGALLALDGKWQQLDKIRLLMGDEVSLQTHKVFKEALRQRVGRLDDSLEHEKGPNPFLEGVEAVVEAIAEGRIECRVYRRNKFHAKAYITHAKFDVVGAQALVGSSNFTKPGLTRNVELNIQVQSGRDVAQLQDWFETHWAAAEDVTADMLRAITRHTAAVTRCWLESWGLRQRGGRRQTRPQPARWSTPHGHLSKTCSADRHRTALADVQPRLPSRVIDQCRCV